MLERLIPIADNVWVFPHNPDLNKVEPTVGVVRTLTHCALIDAGNSPQHAQRILHALNDANLPPVSHVIYTHFHWDHTFGGCLWDGPFIAQRQTPDLLCRYYASQAWTGRYMAHQQGWLENPARVLGDWSQLRIVPPRITFDDHLELKLSGITLLLKHVGGQHAPDSITVQVEESGVLFLGDCFYSPPGRPDIPPDFAMLRGLMHASIETYVMGHNSHTSREGLELYLNSTTST